MHAQIYKKIDPLFIEQWHELWQKSSYANYINSPQWFLSVIDTFHYSEYAIIAVYNATDLIGVAALVEDKKYGISCYTVAPGDFVCGVPFLLDTSNTKLVEMLCEKLLSLGTVYLDNVPGGFAAAISAYTNDYTQLEQTINLYFPITKDSNDVVNVPKRSRLTNRIKGREEEFTVETYDGRSEQGMEMVFVIDNESSKQEKGYSAFSDKKIRDLYINLQKHFGKYFLITVLYFNKVPIAYYIGFLAAKRYYWSQNAYISEYSQFSPGKILLVKLIDYLGTQNVTELNFGSGDYRMKRLLTDEHEVLYAITLSRNATVRGYIMKVKNMKNTVYEKLSSSGGLYSMYKKGKQLFKIA